MTFTYFSLRVGSIQCKKKKIIAVYFARNTVSVFLFQNVMFNLMRNWMFVIISEIHQQFLSDFSLSVLFGTIISS